MKREVIKVTIGGQDIIFETGKIARQANGAVLVRCGDTIVFSTACAAPIRRQNRISSRVDYQEKFSSAGKTLSGFING